MKICKHVYESDCHGIEMLLAPDGREFAIGGTNVKDRFKYDPWCGGRILKNHPITKKNVKLRKVSI